MVLEHNFQLLNLATSRRLSRPPTPTRHIIFVKMPLCSALEVKWRVKMERKPRLVRQKSFHTHPGWASAVKTRNSSLGPAQSSDYPLVRYEGPRLDLARRDYDEERPFPGRRRHVAASQEPIHIYEDPEYPNALVYAKSPRISAKDYGIYHEEFPLAGRGPRQDQRRISKMAKKVRFEEPSYSTLSEPLYADPRLHEPRERNITMAAEDHIHRTREASPRHNSGYPSNYVTRIPHQEPSFFKSTIFKKGAVASPRARSSSASPAHRNVSVVTAHSHSFVTEHQAPHERHEHAPRRRVDPGYHLGRQESSQNSRRVLHPRDEARSSYVGSVTLLAQPDLTEILTSFRHARGFSIPLRSAQRVDPRDGGGYWSSY